MCGLRVFKLVSVWVKSVQLVKDVSVQVPNVAQKKKKKGESLSTVFNQCIWPLIGTPLSEANKWCEGFPMCPTA